VGRNQYGFDVVVWLGTAGYLPSEDQPGLKSERHDIRTHTAPPGITKG